MRLLITGAAGRIGRTLICGLRERHELRGFDLQPMPDLDDAIVGSVADLKLLADAVDGMDAVIHLGANPGGGATWEQVLQNNIIGTYNVFEACREQRVKRLAFASRAGILGAYPTEQRRTVDMMPVPGNYYTISKVFGENLGYMYSSRFDMEVVSVRIGNFNPERDQPEHPHHLSHGDAVRVFERAVVHPGVKFEIVFGVSDSNWPLYDVDHGRRVIGYDPQDFADVPVEKRE